MNEQRAAPRERALRERALWRRVAAAGAQKGPEWFVRFLPVLIGALSALSFGKMRRAVGRNLIAIRGPVGVLRQARETVLTFVEFAWALTAALAPLRPMFQERRIELVGEEYVRPLLERRTGMLMLTAHVGPWDACALRLRSMMDVPVLMLMSEEPDPEAEAFHDEVRKSAQVSVLRMGTNPLDALPLLEHIQKGGIVVAQLDRLPASGRGIRVSLFSRPFEVPEGLFRLALALHCPVVPVFAGRLDSATDRVVVSPPIWVTRCSTDLGLVEPARAVVARFEAHLREFPTQWFHFVE